VGSLRELSLEANPCSKDRLSFFRNILKYMSFIRLLDGKPPTLADAHDSKDEDDEGHGEVLPLIAAQWEEEKKRIQGIELANGSKREYLKTTMVMGGHAEIEDESILFIYGNSYEVVLADTNFQ
jgi:hypothetical protein